MLDKNENMEKPSIRPSLHDIPKPQQPGAGHSVLDAAIGMQNQKQKQQTRVSAPPKNNRPSLVMGALFVALCAGTALYKNWPTEEASTVAQAKPVVNLAEPVIPAKPEILQADTMAAAPEQNNLPSSQPSPFAELTKQDEHTKSTEPSNSSLSTVVSEGVPEAALEPLIPSSTAKPARPIKREVVAAASKPKSTKVSKVSSKSQKTTQKASKSSSKKAATKANAKGSASNKNVVQSKPRPVVLASTTVKPKKNVATTDSDVKLFEVLITQIRKQEKAAQADHADTSAKLTQ